MAERSSVQLSLASPAAAVIAGLLRVLTMHTLAQQFNYVLGAVLLRNIKAIPFLGHIFFKQNHFCWCLHFFLSQSHSLRINADIDPLCSYSHTCA